MKRYITFLTVLLLCAAVFSQKKASQGKEVKNQFQQEMKKLEQQEARIKINEKKLTSYSLHLKGLSNKDISEKIGTTEGFTAKLLSKTRKPLRDFMSRKYGYSISEIDACIELADRKFRCELNQEMKKIRKAGKNE